MMQAFIQNVEYVFELLLVVGALVVGYIIWHHHKLAEARRRREDAFAKQEEGKALLATHQANLVYNELAMRQFQMQLASRVQQQGGTFEWTANGFRASGVSIKQVDTPVRPQIAAPVIEETPRIVPLPTNVRYEDIRTQVPRGHVLVGIGRDGIETKEQAVGACVWIVGLSGTGKTSTTVLRVEERFNDGHKFMGIDPHWFKPDSLTNAVKAYAPHFIRPMATSPEEALLTLQAFIAEFNGRKAGRIPQPWQKITLLVDEVGSIMDPTTPEEEEVAKLLPTVARICGQEARNFLMGGILISQLATGLAWLRKVALMVIVHQLLQDSEKKLATNNDKEVMEDMKSWPIGRTYIYGVGFTDGPRTVQQPSFAIPRIVESTVSYMEDLQPRMTGPLQEQQAFKPTSGTRPFLRVVEVDTEGTLEVAPKRREAEMPIVELSEREKKIHTMFFQQRMSINKIVQELCGPDVKGGAKYQEMSAIVTDAIRKVAQQTVMEA